MDHSTPDPSLSNIVDNPYLQAVLRSCAHTREQCMALIDLVEANPVAEGRDLSHETQIALSKQQKVLNSHLGQLRGLNRNSILKVRNTKQHTAEARQEIDRLHLQLQNLYYEEMHLRGEIANCEAYECVLSLDPAPRLGLISLVTNTNNYR